MSDSHAAMVEEIARLKRQRDEARTRVAELKEVCLAWEQGCHFNWKEHAHEAETAQGVLVGALGETTRELDKQGHIVYGGGPVIGVKTAYLRGSRRWYSSTLDVLKRAREALASLDPSVERIQKIVKAAEAIAEEHAKATAALNVNQPSYGPWKDYAHPPCECDICKAVREKEKTDG